MRWGYRLCCLFLIMHGASVSAAPLDAVLPVLKEWEADQRVVSPTPKPPKKTPLATIIPVLKQWEENQENVPAPPTKNAAPLAHILPVLRGWEKDIAAKEEIPPPPPQAKPADTPPTTLAVRPSDKPAVISSPAQTSEKMASPIPIYRPSWEQHNDNNTSQKLPGYIPIPIQRAVYDNEKLLIPIPVRRQGQPATYNSKLASSAFSGNSTTTRDISRYGFIWPVNGLVVSRFGPKKGGLRNDGINIGVREGTSVYSTQKGEVVYAGNELKGYGNLVIIKHTKGYLSAYAHLKQITVAKGDDIPRGGRIGYVGRTGNVSEPQLHFGLRKGKKPLNPTKYLPTSTIRSASR